MVKSVKVRKAKQNALLGVSTEAKNATIDRSEFDAVMKKLLEAKRPITKDEISARVARRHRAASHAGKRSGQR